MEKHFDTAFAEVIGLEGGYVNHPADRGGPTKYGICQRDHPLLDIPSLTLDAAKAIYKRDYWDVLRLDEVFDGELCFEMFECGVNQGVAWAAIHAQEALNFLGVDVDVDGSVGRKTIAALNSFPDKHALLVAMNCEQYGRYKTIVRKNASQAVFARGWLRRIAL